MNELPKTKTTTNIPPPALRSGAFKVDARDQTVDPCMVGNAKQVSGTTPQCHVGPPRNIFKALLRDYENHRFPVIRPHYGLISWGFYVALGGSP